ncbi:MAG: dTMP kinase, partial [Candidatus Hydrogenedentes bacterium]|nr:dTMP kinase [Candidatus Hydrogenedentota bacterium]
KGHTVTLTREPGGTPLAERIRDLLLDCREESVAPLTELFLYEAARAQHVNAVILPALSRGEIVLCDRYVDSTTAYQGAGRQVKEGTIVSLNRLAAGDAWPDHTFILDMPADKGLQRARARGSDDRMMTETLEFHQRIREEFLALANREPERITIVDAGGSLETIQQDLRDQIDRIPKFNDTLK